jgi:adenylate kinase
MRLVLLGAPGSGKGTQAEKLVQKYQLPHISTGNILREAINNKNELGELAFSYIKQGMLVPDDVIIQVVEERLNKPDCAPGFILDGFPRTINQAKSFEKWIETAGQRLDAVIYLQVPEQILVERLVNRRVCSQCQAVYHLIYRTPKQTGQCDLCGGKLIQRPDDEEVTVKQRLKVYTKQTAPLLAFYKNLGLLVVINGANSADAIFASLVDTLTKK